MPGARCSDYMRHWSLRWTNICRALSGFPSVGTTSCSSCPRHRVAHTVLTSAGVRRFRQAAPIYLAGIEAQFAASFTDDELHTLAELLDRALG